MSVYKDPETGKDQGKDENEASRASGISEWKENTVGWKGSQRMWGGGGGGELTRTKPPSKPHKETATLNTD